MEFTPRRVLLFLLFSGLVLLSWKNFVIDPMREAERRQAEVKQRLEEDQAKEKPAAEDSQKQDTGKARPPKDKAEPSAAVAEKPTATKPAAADVEVPEKVAKPATRDQNPAAYPHQEVTLGSLDPKSGYFFQATLTTTGAAVSSLELNDPRYQDLEVPDTPLSLLKPVPKPAEAPGPGEEYYRTFATSFPEIDQLLKPKGIHVDTVDWNVVTPEKPDPNKVTFEYVIPGKYRLTKEYKVNPPVEEGGGVQELRDTQTPAYFLSLKIRIENLQEQAEEVHYLLQGPVGIPLEDSESTSKFRDIKLGTVNEGELTHQSLTVKDLTKTINKGKDVEQWAAPYRYVGVDAQFFAALLYNSADENPTTEQIENYIPQVLRMNEDQPQYSNVSVLFTSKTLDLKPGEERTHQYTLYAGPKRQALLDQLSATEIMEFGWFGWISKGLLAVLSFLHNNLLLPYGLAIVGLTILVRGALFPLSKKQAYSAARMKELQPKLQELKKKYGDDKQKFAQVQMELFRDAGYNPFAGCLPMVLQLPIFIGLYGAIRQAIDLRAADFLWVDNLAAPDHLFQLPISVWWMGQYFNLLPIVTVGLFLVQQKMFMPTPDPDDEQAQMQHKMMNFMMIFMGFLFYHMPAGLCIYFIASSLWGMGERKLLDLGKNKNDKPEEADSALGAKGGKPSFKTGPQNGREKGGNIASKKRGKKSKSRR